LCDRPNTKASRADAKFHADHAAKEGQVVDVGVII